MKVAIPPRDPCIRCNGPIVNTPEGMVCQRCKQRWALGPEGCWEAEFEENKEAREEHAKALAEFMRKVSKTWRKQ